MVSILTAGFLGNTTIQSAMAMDMGRGAIAGAMIVALAFLAGYAAFRRSGLAVCGLLMVLTAAALEFSWLGLFSSLSTEVTTLLLALFAAAAIIFVSVAVGAARFNPLIGGIMFTAALVIGGLGLLNFMDRINTSSILQWTVMGAGGVALIFALIQAFRGDAGARLILPGIALAAIAPAIGPLTSLGGDAFALAPHGLFTLGVLSASLVALTDGAPFSAHAASNSEPNHFTGFSDSGSLDEYDRPHHDFGGSSRDESEEIALDGQLAKVLDYSGVAIWDWSPDYAEQTESLPGLLGADSNGAFTPDALRNFISSEDLPKFDAELITPVDGPFDVALSLFDGRKVRFRGARVADENAGALERIVAFIETASPVFAPSADAGISGNTVRKATEAAIVPVAATPIARELIAAIDSGDIHAAFQPIVSLAGEKTVGYEALARWTDQKNGADEGPEKFVKLAETAGKGAALANTMLDEAAAFLSEKIKTEKRRDLFVALNVSWGQMRNAGFVENVAAAMANYKLPSKSLVLELTESDEVRGDQKAEEVFKALKKAGAALAFDDFGAGFSCLSNLKDYEFDYLKIDKSFAVDLDKGGDGAKIVESLVGLGKSLGLKVIVEGVESKAAAKKAKDLGCAYGQGFAFGKPEGPKLSKAPIKTKESRDKDETTAKSEKSLNADEDTPATNEAVDNADEKSTSEAANNNEAELSAANETKPAADAARWTRFRSRR